MRCKLNHELKHEGRHKLLWEYYQALIRLRKSEAALAFPNRERMEILALEPERVLVVRRWAADNQIVTMLHFGAEPASASFDLPAGTWVKVLDSAESRWDGPGSSLPEQMESAGKVEFSLTPNTAIVYKRLN